MGEKEAGKGQGEQRARKGPGVYLRYSVPAEGNTGISVAAEEGLEAAPSLQQCYQHEVEQGDVGEVARCASSGRLIMDVRPVSKSQGCN